MKMKIKLSLPNEAEGCEKDLFRPPPRRVNIHFYGITEFLFLMIL